MAATKNHPYHILPPSLWPLIGSFSALALTAGGVLWMHDNPYGKFVLLAGAMGVLLTMYSWWRDVVHESRAGDHTPIVQLHLRYGMILFIASEVMFFLAWFWAFFDNALFPSAVESVGGVWPPEGQKVLDPLKWPLLMTLILLCSGTTVTYAHQAVINGDQKGLKLGLLLTIALGCDLHRCRPTNICMRPSPSRSRAAEPSTARPS
jgi:cytochrome c oxidase subunit 3